MYNNKIFSYGYKKHLEKNFNRKDFSLTWNQRVIFADCRFEQTIFTTARIENCLFINCKFSNCSFVNCSILYTTFENSSFYRVLFDQCTITNSLFESNSYSDSMVYPFDADVYAITTSSKIKYTDKQKETIYKLLNQLKAKQNMRDTKSLFHTKRRMNRSKREKEKYKRIRPKEAKRLGLTKKERLLENRRRKSDRNTENMRYSEETKLGNHTSIKEGPVLFLMSIYPFEELYQGLKYACTTMNKKQYPLSYLMKIIENNQTDNEK